MPCLIKYDYHDCSNESTMSLHRCCCSSRPHSSSITSSLTSSHPTSHHLRQSFLSSPLILTLTFFLSFLVLFSHNVPSVDSQAIEHSNASHLAVPKFFTLTRPHSALRLIANGTVARRLIASKREISFDFRTRYPNGIILYETFYERELLGSSFTSSSSTSPHRLYTLLVSLLHGRFQVILECGDDQPTKELLLGYGFNRDHLHHVDLNIFPELNFLSVRINASSESGSGRPYYHSLYFNGSSLLQNGGKSKGKKKQSKFANVPTQNVDQLTYKLTFGRIPFPREAAYYSLNGYRPFVGCLGAINIISRSNESNFGTLSQATWSTTEVDKEGGCVDQCELLNLCSRRAKCINYYDGKTCDCFGTELEDWHCRRFNYTVVRLRGYSTISYPLYRFLSRTYVDEQRISFHLKTAADAVLWAGLAEARQSYLILNLKGGHLNVLLNLGGNPKNYVFTDFRLTDGRWHNLTVVQEHSVMYVYLDTDTVHRIDFDEAEPFFFFDPEIYIGGFPSNLNISNLNLPIYLPNKKFIGCLKHVYYNAMNILYDLFHRQNGAKYHSLYPLETGCNLEEQKPLEVLDALSVPITIQPNAYFRVPTNRTAHFQLDFELRLERFTVNGNSKIANGSLLTATGERRRWHLWLRRQDVKLSIETEAGGSGGYLQNFQQQQQSFSSSKSMIGWTLSNDNSLNETLGVWNRVRIIGGGRGSFFKMTVNDETVQGRYTDHHDDESVEGSRENHFEGDVFLGSIAANTGYHQSFVGCFRNVYVNYRPVEARTLAALGLVTGRVSLDDCQLLRPCNRPNACEHGGVCIPIPANGTYICDCSNTGYIGRKCHFSMYRRSCEEVYLMDKRHSGIFMIDIDRNGPLPPAHVICDLERSNNRNRLIATSADEQVSTKTVIEHNIQHQVIVRDPKARTGHYQLDVVYRDFSPAMLRTLIRRSGRCRQYVKYECNDAPLSLSSYTQLFSTLPDHRVRYIDSVAKGCKCKGVLATGNSTTSGRCVDPSRDCNCDSNSKDDNYNGWRHDEGELTSSDDVGITKMYFFQLPNSTDDTEAHLFIGNLSCVDVNTQQYEITFKTKQSYLQVPGWVGREMGISFRTTASKAVIFYQAHLDSTTTYFKAEIQSEKEVSFEYSLLGRKSRISISSGHCLNCGQWQHIWIERAEYQMRVSINQNSRIMYLGKSEKFIDFDGKLFVGGAPLEYLKGRKITTGYIGCLRGLVFDSEVIDLHRYLDAKRKPNIESGCRPYCKPNLCANQGHCVEKWGTYECRCANAIAHSGRNCEVNINENSATFKRAPAFLRKRYTTDDQVAALLTEDLIFSFRTHEKSALLLYAHDRRGNFMQVHIEDANVIFTYNWLRKIVRREIAVGNLLKSGQEVQVKVDRSYRNSSLLMVNSKSVFIPYPTAVLRNVMEDAEINTVEHENSESQWLKGHEFELVKRVNGAWSSTSAGARGELMIGGLAPDSATTTLPAFVGCIQGLVAGGHLIDLHSMANDQVQRSRLESIANDNTTSNVTSNVAAGCTMLCDLMPCKNGGTCTEDWATDSTKCDCESTSYRGDLCDLDIGALFSSKNASVLYHLEDSGDISAGGGSQVFDFSYVNISFAFSTANYENSTLLLLRYANSSRYLHLALLADGRLLVEEDNGHQIFMSIIESEEDSFLDGHRHWVQYVRKEPHHLFAAEMIVDSLIYRIEPTTDRETLKAVPPSTENIIQIGSNRLNNTEMGYFHNNFKGCISNINIHLDSLRVDPFESAFGISNVGLSRVKVLGDVKQGVCAVFTTTDHRSSSVAGSGSLPLSAASPNSFQDGNPLGPVGLPLSSAAGAEIWLSRPKPTLVRFNVSTDGVGEGFEGGARYASSSYFINHYLRRQYLLPLCITYLIIVLFFVSLYIYRIDRRYKLLKFEQQTPFFHHHKNGGSVSSNNNNNGKHTKRKKNFAM